MYVEDSESHRMKARGREREKCLQEERRGKTEGSW